MHSGINYHELLSDGVAHWNQWRKQNPGCRPILRNVDLAHTYLFEIDLSDSDLRGANFTRACLIGADLSRADLQGANLEGAYLNDARLRRADLGSANLLNAQMLRVDLLNANLVGTCLSTTHREESRSQTGSISISISQETQPSVLPSPLMRQRRKLPTPLVLGPVSTATRVAKG